MAFLPQEFTFGAFVTGTTQTPSLELPGAFLNLYLIVPTMSTGYAGDTQIWIRGATSASAAFFRYVNVETNTNTVGASDFAIVSSTSQRIVYIPNFAFRYVKVEVSGATTSNISIAPVFKIVAVTNQ